MTVQFFLESTDLIVEKLLPSMPEVALPESSVSMNAKLLSSFQYGSLRESRSCGLGCVTNDNSKYCTKGLRNKSVNGLHPKLGTATQKEYEIWVSELAPPLSSSLTALDVLTRVKTSPNVPIDGQNEPDQLTKNEEHCNDDFNPDTFEAFDFEFDG